MSYTNIFGGFNINTAFPSYASYTFAANIQLNWASSFVDSPPGVNNVTAQINDLNATGVGLTVTLANATLISVGQTVQFNNVGANAVTINDFSGGFIATIPPVNNNQYVLYLRDNSTPAGTWGITHLGAGTSQADANALSGFGTISLNSEINTNFPGKTIGANYVVQLTDRASILVWTGGVGTITLPPQLAGFYISVNNEGSGVVTINTPDATTIDGQATFALNPSQSSYFIGVAANWNTLGFGVESFFQVNVLNAIDLSLVNPSITLTASQSSRLVNQFTGNLANNVTVFYPAAAGQWYIWNNTNGPFNLFVQLAGPTGNAVQIPQGEKVIIYSDGTSMYNIPTIATSAVFPDGNVGAPGINFQAQNSTGFYRISSGLVGYSSAGTQGLTFGGPISGYGLGISGGLASRYYNAANTQFVGFRAGALLGSFTWTLPLADATSPNQLLFSNGASTLGFTTATYPITTTINQLLYSITPNAIAGLATANNGVLVTSNVGTPFIGNTLPTLVQSNITQLGIIIAGTWNGTPITVPFGGTGINTTTPFGVLCGGTIATGPFQNAGQGAIGQIFTSNGVGALPSWKSGAYATTLGQFSNMSNPNPTINRIINIASIVRSSVGNYTITFTTPYINPNYPVLVNAGFNSFPMIAITGTQTTNSVQVAVYNLIDQSFSDPSNLSIAIMGT